MNTQRILDLVNPITASHDIHFEVMRDAERGEHYLIFRKRYPNGVAGPGNAVFCGLSRRAVPVPDPGPTDDEYRWMAEDSVSMVERAAAMTGPAWPLTGTTPVHDVNRRVDDPLPTGMTIASLIGDVDAIRTEGFETRDLNYLYLTDADWRAVKEQCLATGMSLIAPIDPAHAATYLPGQVGTLYGCPVFISYTNSMQCDSHRVPLNRDERAAWVKAWGL